MGKNKKIVILGGGTFSPIRNHLSLCAPAFGTTARQLDKIFDRYKAGDKYEGIETELYLTDMAGKAEGQPIKVLKTNDDVEELIDSLIKREDVGTIILNVAFCDFDVVDELAGFHGPRLKTSLGDRILQIRPAKKIIDKIRRERPDIFLVGFKTTTNASKDEQFLTALKMMKRSKCNLVLANDVVTRHNMIITPEESKYVCGSRETGLTMLCDIVLKRNNLTYHRTNFRVDKNTSMDMTPESFRDIMSYLIKNGGFIENNGNGFTPGHFCFRPSDDGSRFLSSQRKINHNELFERGLTDVVVVGDKFYATGSHKPSVGARSQWLMLQANPGYDCIIHTHNPLKEGSKIPVVSQLPYQCGSLECGMNTVNNLGDFGNIKAVYLDKHGVNIMFRCTTPAEEVIAFIEENIELGIKTT